MDCDGVLTDGRLYFSEGGEAMKVFDVRDGQGIVSWHNAGFKSGIISGRGAGEIIQRRADELGIEFVRISSTDKVKDLVEIAGSLNLELNQVAYVGDDVGDIAIMKRVGFAVAVADAVPQARAVANHVTTAKGGRGAVREVVEMLLASRKNSA